MATHDPTTSDLEALLGGDQDWRRFLPWAGGIVLLIVAAVTAYVLTSGGETVTAVAPEPAQASTGSITSTTTLSGTAAAAQSAGLTFADAGVVTSLQVAVGNEVQAGDLLATLDDAEAARQVETAQISLDQAEASLAELLGDPDAAELASALSTLRSAESQVASAGASFNSVVDGATESDLLSAESALANALSQLSSAEETLAAVIAPPDASELANANSALSQAQAQLNNATIDVTATFEDAVDDQASYCSWSGHITSPLLVECPSAARRGLRSHPDIARRPQRQHRARHERGGLPRVERELPLGARRAGLGPRRRRQRRGAPRRVRERPRRG